MDQKLTKSYPHLKTEKEWLRLWEENRVFEISEKSGKMPFSIMLLPPNQMGLQPFGNIVSSCLADIIARRKKMQGFHVFGFPSPGINGMIPLLKRIGVSRPWMNPVPDHSTGVQNVLCKVFVQLYQEGKIVGNARNRVSGEKKGKKTCHFHEWLLRAGDMVEPAVAALEKNDIVFIPEKWKWIFLSRLRQIGDCCISWPSPEGQHIPAFCCRSCGTLVVSEETPAACGKCHSRQIFPDEHVMGSRFIWALWPLAAFGWQSGSGDSRISEPASLIAMSQDFSIEGLVWMILITIHLGKGVPFREVLISSLVRGVKKRKKGNAGDEGIALPVIISEYGADALRFAMAIQAVPNASTALPVSRIRGCKAFANKVWNASRYILLMLKEGEDGQIDFGRITDTDRWILHLLNITVSKVNELLESYSIGEAAGLLFHFIRDGYCHWYLEFSKADAGRSETWKVLRFTWVCVLRLLHPFMPFLTEEIYHRIEPAKINVLQAPFPEFDPDLVFNKAFLRIEFLKKLIVQTRKMRSENYIHPGQRIPVFLKAASPNQQSEFQPYMGYFDSLVRSQRTEMVTDFSGLGRGRKGFWQNWEILIPFANEEEWKKQVRRLEQDHRKIEELVLALEDRISGMEFSGEALQDLKKSLLEANEKRRKLEKAIADLS